MAGTFRQLEVFAAVCSSGTFAAAAEDLGISQAAVSRHIAALEAACGHALYDRRPGAPAVLTFHGREFLKEAEHILDRSRTMGYSLTGRSQRSFRVRVGADPTILNTVFRLAMGAPEIEGRPIEIVLEPVEPASDPTLVLQEGKLDLIYCTHPLDQIGPASPLVLVAAYESGMFVSAALAEQLRANPAMSVPVILPPERTPLELSMRRSIEEAGVRHYHVAAHVPYEHGLELAYTGLGAVLMARNRLRAALDAGLLVELVEVFRPHTVGRFVLRSPRAGAVVMEAQKFLSNLLVQASR